MKNRARTVAITRNKMKINETPNKIETPNKGVEKIKGPRLLQSGRKETQTG
jgi:hypothetical protein